MNEPIWRRSATELAELMAAGDVSAREVVDAHLTRIEEVNGWLNALVLVDADGRVLLAQRPEGKSMAGLWEFPGGKVEAGETPEAALIRELGEELAEKLAGELAKELAGERVNEQKHSY